MKYKYNFNINSQITIGNNVGLRPNVDLITHGYWQSVLKGFPFREGPIVIKDNVIVGRNSIILPKVTLCENAVIGAGSAQGSLDAANIMKPALVRGDFRCIGATTLDEYRKHIEKDAALERRFQPACITAEMTTRIIAVELIDDSPISK